MINKTAEIVAGWKMKQESDLLEIKSFLLSISKNSHGIPFRKLHETHEDIFSEMDCLQCANCCRTTPPIYTKKDVKKIAQFLGTNPKQFIKKYTIEDVNGELTGIVVPCSFLNDDNTCKIYEVRPQACREYPHTDDENFSLRPEMNYNNTIVCPAAYAIARRLMIISPLD